MPDTSMTMVERVAKAIYESWLARWPSAEQPAWEKAGDYLRDQFIAYARAALSALQSPSERMVEAGAVILLGEVEDKNLDLTRSIAGEVFREMMDAALEESR